MTLTAPAPTSAAPVRKVAVPVDGIGALLAGTANVVMQLSWAPVGYGVLESPVESGQIMRHPAKRFRTTFTYLAVALYGTSEERATYRRAVDRVHAQVRSTADSPVPYRAFDRDLQAWVGACLVWGTADVMTKLHGAMDDATADALYVASTPLATTLQVREEDWPADRAGFASLWEHGLGHVDIPPPVRAYLLDLVALRFLPLPLRAALAADHRFWTTGFLPPVFREQLGLPWSDADQRRFERRLGRIGWASRHLPPVLRAFPLNVVLADFRRRVRTGQPLV